MGERYTYDTVVARVDRDYLAEPGETSRVGTEWTIRSIANTFTLLTATEYSDFGVTDTYWESAVKVRFRLLDGDGEVYYGGWLINDEECIVQQAVLSWGTYDAGCSDIEVRAIGEDNAEWRMEIG